MINAHCRKFLKYLRTNSPDFEDRVFTYSYLEANYAEPIESVFAMARFLKKEGYIEVALNHGNSFGVILTELGAHPHQFKWEIFKSFLLRSILAPIVISIITTLLTLWIKGLLSGP
ncbi:hypothetical protein [Diplocloster hominis]|uniref:hypothetical protein n=1 Tax=Diplocloster hominis TaxID=3079010 RepID=UPI0031BADA67